MFVPVRPLLEAAEILADRFASALAALMRAAGRIGVEGGHPTLSREHAANLYHRVTPLLMHFLRVCNFGIRVPDPRPPKPRPDPDGSPEDATPPPAPPHRSGGAGLALPRRPGWLLEALPELAPEVADQFRDLLAHWAATALFDQAPVLLRRLRPVLRSLGVELPERIAPPPQPRSRRDQRPQPRPDHRPEPPTIAPAPPAPPAPPAAQRISPSAQVPSHA